MRLALCRIFHRQGSRFGTYTPGRRICDRFRAAELFSESWQHGGSVGTYYYKAESGQSTWDKPDELKTEEELAQNSTPWKTYKTAEGREYYYNTETKQSVPSARSASAKPGTFRILLVSPHIL